MDVYFIRFYDDELNQIAEGVNIMVEIKTLEEVTRRVCDYCGKPALGGYSKCQKCGKDICQQHHGIWGEEDCYCVYCHPMAKERGRISYDDDIKKQNKAEAVAKLRQMLSDADCPLYKVFNGCNGCPFVSEPFCILRLVSNP